MPAGPRRAAVPRAGVGCPQRPLGGDIRVPQKPHPAVCSWNLGESTVLLHHHYIMVRSVTAVCTTQPFGIHPLVQVVCQHLISIAGGVQSLNATVKGSQRLAAKCIQTGTSVSLELGGGGGGSTPRT